MCVRVFKKLRVESGEWRVGGLHFFLFGDEVFFVELRYFCATLNKGGGRG